MNQQNKLSKRNKTVAIARWKKEKEKLNLHLENISYLDNYKPFKSRLLGYLAGDGSVSVRKEKANNIVHHDIAFYPDHLSMIGSFLEAFTGIYLRKPTIRYRGNHYSLKISSKYIVQDLMKTASFGIHKWQVPFNFLDSEECKVEWLKAFFDCESSVIKWQIQVQSVNKKGLYQVKHLLGIL
ncbi:hypothetical protein HY491_03305, partial [Candidatus Woesearchaeota archaeon]|nr:hypothetical protein [Candidatus Woesearchaeota archaeon]